MKKALVIALLSLSMATLGGGVAYAMGMRCTFCKGTGFQGDFSCFHCKGTGKNSDY